jgi:hypothetical protein
MSPDEVRAMEWDCTKLIYRFYRCLDEHLYDELANLFTATGAWVRLGKELVGPQMILSEIRERKNWMTAHLVTNVQIAVTDESHADSWQYVTLYRHEDWDPARGPAPVVLPLGILRHRDKLVREDGAWKFQRKTSNAVMTDRSRVSHYDKQ